jgi:hypothetical protein
MRSVARFVFVVPALAVCLLSAAPASATAPSLRLEPALLGEVAQTLQQASAAVPLPVLDLLVAQTSHPAPRNLPPKLTGVGLGLQVGSPTSVTLKIGGLQQNGFVIGLGSGFAYTGVFAPNLSVHVDYLFHVATLVHNADVALTAYVGPGLWLALGTYGYGFGLAKGAYSVFPFGVGVRMPLGLSLAFSAAPIEVYLELDPALFVFPPADFGVGASLGFRYHF